MPASNLLVRRLMSATLALLAYFVLAVALQAHLDTDMSNGPGVAFVATRLTS